MRGQAHSQLPPEDRPQPDTTPAKSPRRLPKPQYYADGISPTALKRIRATKMLELLIYGQSLEVIAVKFNTTKRAVRSHLRAIEREGFLEQVETTVLKDLLPLAAQAFGKALKRSAETGDLSNGAAQMILKETGLLKRAGGATNDLRDDETIEALIIRRRKEREVEATQEPVAALPPASETLPETTVTEGEVIPSENPQETAMDQQ